MRFPLRRAGVLLLVLVLCLAVVGVGYGKWSGTLKIRGDMTTAASAIKVGWTQVQNSDPGVEPDDSCSWHWDWNTWTNWDEGGQDDYPLPGQDNVAEEKHVGWTDSIRDPATLITICENEYGTFSLYRRIIVTLNNVYPCYAVKVFPTARNCGPLPAKIVGWTITPDWYPEGFTYQWDPDAGAYGTGAWVSTDYPTGFDPNRPYNIGMSDGGYPIILQPDCASMEEFVLVVHVEQAAQQDHTYTFGIEVHVEPAY